MRKTMWTVLLLWALTPLVFGQKSPDSGDNRKQPQTEQNIRVSKTPVNVGRTVQLFVDDYMIEMAHFVTRTMHSPQKHPLNPLVKKDRPWEKVLYFRTNTFNVYQDNQEKLFKLWYEDLGWDYEGFMGRGGKSAKKDVVRQAAEHGALNRLFAASCQNRYLYAESEDGLHWRKPELDYRQMDGRNTNIVLGTEKEKVHACTVLLDPLERDPRKRFKALYWAEGESIEFGQLTAASSANGRAWTKYDQPVIIGGQRGHMTGDVIILTADPQSGLYWLDTRDPVMQERPRYPKQPLTKGWGVPYYPNEPLRTVKRRISSTLSYNILEWPGLKETLTPIGPEVNLDSEFYGMVRFRVGDLYFAFLVLHRKTANTQEIQLLYSRNGVDWNWAGERRPFLDRGGPGEWDQFTVETCTPPVRLQDAWRIYYAGANVHHDWWMFGEQEGMDHPEARTGWNGGETALGVATLRPEGFVSIDALVRDGIVITPAIVSGGRRLFVNIACGDKGYFEAELTDADDNVVPGYERSKCDTFHGDSIRHLVTWNGRSEIPREVLSAGAKLRFYFRNASLYSFTIE